MAKWFKVWFDTGFCGAKEEKWVKVNDDVPDSELEEEALQMMNDSVCCGADELTLQEVLDTMGVETEDELEECWEVEDRTDGQTR